MAPGKHRVLGWHPLQVCWALLLLALVGYRALWIVPECSVSASASAGNERMLLRYKDFTDYYGNLSSLLDDDELHAVEMYTGGGDEMSDRRYRCHRVDLPVRQLTTVPVPSEWCEAGESDGTLRAGEKPIYLFVMGAPYTGTSATAGILFAATNATHMCQKRLHKEPQCEGWKNLVDERSEQAKKRWWTNITFVDDFQDDVLGKYDKLWFDKTKLFRVDKSLPFTVHVGQMVEQLVDRDGERVAFIFMTRSPCTKPSKGSMNDRFMHSHAYLLERKIPVLHVHYEDFFSDLDGVERRITQWAKCLTADTSKGYLEITKEVNGEHDAEALSKSRLQPLREYAQGKFLEDMQETKSLVTKSDLLSLAYFGYPIEPASR